MIKLFYSITDSYPPYRSDVAELFGNELRRKGMQITWYMNSGDPKAEKSDVLPGQRIYLPFAREWMPPVMSRLIYWASDCLHMMLRLFRSDDVIQCRDKYIGSLIGLLVAKLKRVPFCYWCSYPFPEHQMEVATGFVGLRRVFFVLKSRLQLGLLDRVICQAADHVFVQSQKMLEDMAGYGISLDRMTPVPMGVASRMLSWLESNRIAVVPNRIVYLGTLASVRRLDMLVDAFIRVHAEFCDAELLFVGDGDDPSERVALESAVRAAGLSECVRFTGFVPMDRAWEYAASAAVCLSPFYPTQVLRSASPTKLVEYLALGRPVVCNDHPEHSRIIAECGAGLCVPWSASAFAEAILVMLRDAKSAEVMGGRGPAWVAAHRTYPRIADAVWSTYQRVVSARQ